MITRDPGYFCGHSTYMEQDILFASVARVVERVNTVIGVTPVKTRYNGDLGSAAEVGDGEYQFQTRQGANTVQCEPSRGS